MKGLGKYVPKAVADKMSGLLAGKEDKKEEGLIEKNKKVFMLTDGEVSDPDKVIQLAKQNNNKVRVHSFGVGFGCSKYLVKEVAKAGRGSYSFVDEQSENLKGKVISALRKAVEPSLKDCKFQYQVTGPSTLEAPTGGVIGEAFRNDMVHQFLILSRD